MTFRYGRAGRCGPANEVGESIYSYDDGMRLSSLTHKNGAGTDLSTLIFAYDRANRLTTETIDGAAKNYGYDSSGQLTFDGAATLTYDDNGSRTSGGSDPTTGNRLSDDGLYTYTYDDESNVTRKTDGSGNYKDYTYDLNNQITRAEYYNAGLATIASRNDYSYGPFGERLESKHADPITPANDWTRRYTYDFWNPEKPGVSSPDIWAEMNAGNSITMRYFDSDNVDGKLARAVTTSEQWLLGDNRNSVRKITGGGRRHDRVRRLGQPLAVGGGRNDRCRPLRLHRPRTRCRTGLAVQPGAVLRSRYRALDDARPARVRRRRFEPHAVCAERPNECGRSEWI